MGSTKRWLSELQRQAANGDRAVQEQLAASGLWCAPEELAEREWLEAAAVAPAADLTGEPLPADENSAPAEAARPPGSRS